MRRNLDAVADAADHVLGIERQLGRHRETDIAGAAIVRDVRRVDNQDVRGVDNQDLFTV